MAKDATQLARVFKIIPCHATQRAVHVTARSDLKDQIVVKV